jgi:hypothetical protein
MEKPLSAKVSWKAMATGFRWRENMPAPEVSCERPSLNATPPAPNLGAEVAGVEPKG